MMDKELEIHKSLNLHEWQIFSIDSINARLLEKRSPVRTEWKRRICQMCGDVERLVNAGWILDIPKNDAQKLVREAALDLCEKTKIERG